MKGDNDLAPVSRIQSLRDLCGSPSAANRFFERYGADVSEHPEHRREL